MKQTREPTKRKRIQSGGQGVPRISSFASGRLCQLHVQTEPTFVSAHFF